MPPPTTAAGAAKLLLRAADEVVVVSEGVLPMFAPAVPRVIHNGDRSAAARAAAARARACCSSAGWSRSRTRSASSRSRGGCPEAKFVVVGDGSLRDQLDAPGVTFLGARDDARALLARAELLLVTSDSEGQSIAVAGGARGGHAGGLDARSAACASSTACGSRASTRRTSRAAVRELLDDPAAAGRDGSRGRKTRARALFCRCNG